MLQWTPLPTTHVGKLVYFLCTESSVLPIRDVLNDQGQGLKLEPNYETGTYNFCRFCNHPSVVAAIRHGYRYLLFVTRYKGLDPRFRGQYYVVGYHDLESWTELGTRKAVKAKRLKFVRIEDAFHVTPEICRKWRTTYGNPGATHAYFRPEPHSCIGAHFMCDALRQPCSWLCCRISLRLGGHNCNALRQ